MPESTSLFRPFRPKKEERRKKEKKGKGRGKRKGKLKKERSGKGTGTHAGKGEDRARVGREIKKALKGLPLRPKEKLGSDLLFHTLVYSTIGDEGLDF